MMPVTRHRQNGGIYRKRKPVGLSSCSSVHLKEKMMTPIAHPYHLLTTTKKPNSKHPKITQTKQPSATQKPQNKENLQAKYKPIFDYKAHLGR
jgi:hypothetical protein